MNHAELTQKREEFKKRLAAIRRDLASGLDQDSDDQAIQLENYETLIEIANVTEKQLLDVQQKLAELDGQIKS